MKRGAAVAMVEKVLNSMIDVFGPLAVVSLLAIAFYLYRHGIYGVWHLSIAFNWPELVSKYRDHTRMTKGKTGIWYYVLSLSFPALIVSIVSLFVLHIIQAIGEK